MKKEIEVPDGVEVSLSGNTITVKGPKGELKKSFLLKNTDLKIDGKKILVSSLSEKRRDKAIAGTVAANIKNMVEGVTKGYESKLKIVYAHFPMTVKVEGNNFKIENFLGEKAPRQMKLPENVEVKVTPPEITISGIDKALVGECASNISQLTKLVKRDKRVFQDGIYVVQKAK